MDRSLKIALGIVLGALAIGLAAYPTLAHNNVVGMMTGSFDMNQMHTAMHSEDANFDMNEMHGRMLAGNLTEEDRNEMREHCPMHR